MFVFYLVYYLNQNTYMAFLRSQQKTSFLKNNSILNYKKSLEFHYITKNLYFF